MRGVRLSDAELADVRAAAVDNGLAVAAFLSLAAVAAARTPLPAAYIADEQAKARELFLARRHLGYVGNNLNQIARALNSGASTPPHTQEILDTVAEAIRRVDAAVDALVQRQHSEPGAR
ncbi:plasmid mobilization relaxosome protein MobC [Streptomyces hainanensis]|uniref:plasmid mobilization relaxosome protein MobC n=1 Tax=Streptomyces hainanensis TaxID=402648 RepID=UPI001FB639D8|nr:plasmid mobilization relaxosome protein MobC [Streptomyces hainanensis]